MNALTLDTLIISAKLPLAFLMSGRNVLVTRTMPVWLMLKTRSYCAMLVVSRDPKKLRPALLTRPHNPVWGTYIYTSPRWVQLPYKWETACSVIYTATGNYFRTQNMWTYFSATYFNIKVSQWECTSRDKTLWYQNRAQLHSLYPLDSFMLNYIIFIRCVDEMEGRLPHSKLHKFMTLNNQ